MEGIEDTTKDRHRRGNTIIIQSSIFENIYISCFRFQRSLKGQKSVPSIQDKAKLIMLKARFLYLE